MLLRSTTFSSFVERFPGGHMSTVAGDVVGIDVAFPDEGMAFLFELEGECAGAVGANVRQAAAELIRVDGFLTRYPACATATLHSVTVRATGSKEQTFYKGSTDQGVALHARRTDVLQRYGRPHDVRGVWTAGSSPNDARFEEVAYASGTLFSFGEAADGPDAGHLVLMKIAIFPPAF